MNYNRNRHQKTAGVIRYSCGILFMLFTFCYLFFIQGEILAEAQHVYSNGITQYSILIGAIIIAFVLQILQWLVSLASRLPARFHALTYVPSSMVLAIISSVNKDVMDSFSFGAWLWIMPLVLAVYAITVILIKNLFDESQDYFKGLKNLLYTNYIILLALILGAGSIPQTSDVYHYELKTERLLLERDYEAACRVGEKSLRSSVRLTQLRMYALAQQGLLPERIFEYPQYYGAQGLFDIADSASSHRFDNKLIFYMLGARCHSSVATTDRYFELLLADSLWNQTTADYYLCSLLLENRMKEFHEKLPLYYNLSDTVVSPYDSLPKAYREALLVMADADSAYVGKLYFHGDSVATLSDTAMVSSYREYCGMKTGVPDILERVNKAHRIFGKTFWWYHDYSDIAIGEIKKRKKK